MFKKTAFLLLVTALLLGGCSHTSSRVELAQSIAAPSGLTPEKIAASPFNVMSYQRLGQPGQPVNVYLEGDGLAWISRVRPSGDPTPTDPVSLRLAAQDHVANVVYLARPCQYGDESDKAKCTVEYWTTQRFAPKILQSVNQALDTIKTKTQASGFNLIGYSGGGAVAVLLAARRSDVLSITTLAGNLDTVLFTQIHGVTPMTGSLNPADVAQAVNRIPQQHFVGTTDDIVPQKIAESFKQRSVNTICVAITPVIANHHHGWAEQWPTLSKMTPHCD